MKFLRQKGHKTVKKDIKSMVKRRFFECFWSKNEPFSALFVPNMIQKQAFSGHFYPKKRNF